MQIKTCQERPRGPSAEGYKYQQEEKRYPAGGIQPSPQGHTRATVRAMETGTRTCAYR